VRQRLLFSFKWNLSKRRGNFSVASSFLAFFVGEVVAFRLLQCSRVIGALLRSEILKPLRR
jgi:hypothetical protein